MNGSPVSAIPRPNGEGSSLVEALDRLLSTGAALSGELAISVADVDLIYVGLRAVVRSSSPEDKSLRIPSGVATRAQLDSRGGLS